MQVATTANEEFVFVVWMNMKTIFLKINLNLRRRSNVQTHAVPYTNYSKINLTNSAEISKYQELQIFLLGKGFLNRKIPLHDRFDFFNLYFIIKYVIDKNHN